MTRRRKLPEGKDDGAKSPPPLSEEESALFRTTVADVRPLPDTGKVVQAPRKPRPRPRSSDIASSAVADGLSDYIPAQFSESDEPTFLRPGMAAQTLKKLRRGHWSIEAELDLHGMTSDEARTSLSGFLDECAALGLRCVRVIHGKGLSSRNQEPVLKLKTASWLMQRSDILAFCPARPTDGGSGVTLALIKNCR